MTLELKRVRLALDGKTLLGPLDLTVAPGEIVTLMGPSGCGKSSLLSYLCGTLDPAFEAEGELRPELRGKKERQARIEEALAEAGMAGFADRDPATLSGGQRARTALMRCLLSEPRALLLDEPFSKLDAELRGRFRRFVFEHAKAAALPTLLVTHDAGDADRENGRTLRLSEGAGDYE
ncbi:MAG: ATP-binding cassette domain-containing protein [Limibacillus sp.]